MTTRNDERSTVSRRRLLGVLSGATVGAIAGCVGGGDDGTPTESTTPTTDSPTSTAPAGPDTGTDTTTTGTDTPTRTAGTATPTDTDTRTETRTETATQTPDGIPEGSDPAVLLEAGDDRRQIAPGSTATVSASLVNPYLFELESGEVTLAPPNDDWTIEATSDTTFDTLAAQGTREVQWEVTTPASASGEYDLTANVSYTAGPDDVDVTTSIPVIALAPLSAPYGIDFGGAHTETAVTIDGLTFLPDSETAASIDITENRPLEENEIWWGGNVTIDPLPNCSHTELFPDTAPDAITNTDHPELYRGEYWIGGEFSIDLNVESGTYDVTVHLAEWFFSVEGERVLDIGVNGEALVEGVDLVADVGFGVAATRTMEGVEIDDGTITVTVASSPAPAKINGLEIRQA